MSTIEGQSVLVTGGGSGIGEAAAAKLAADGANVVICGRTEDKLVAAVERIRESAVSNAVVKHVIADVTVEEEVQAAVDATAAITGRIDGLFACAGGSTHLGPMATSDVDPVRATMELNYIGTFNTMKAAGQLMAKQGGGSMVGCSSHAGADPFQSLGAYGASKAAVDHLCRVMANELGHLNVRVNSIQPGLISTEIMGPVTDGGPLLDDYLPKIPMGRVGEPDEVADLVRFLIGPESKWITGQLIAIDGGQNLRGGADYNTLLRSFGAEPLAELELEP